MNTSKTGVAVALVLLSFLCLFRSPAVAENTVAAVEEIAGHATQNNEWREQTEVRKPGFERKEKAAHPESIEKRRAALLASFRKAGITPDVIDELFSDERVEIYHNIYLPPVPKEGEARKRKLSYFDEEFGLLKPDSIESGRRLLAENKELFAKLERIYGVPANYIVAIIRVETNFKEHLGEYAVFNSLYTMALLSKRTKRVRMAANELVTWVKMCRQRGIDPFTVKGSWAGAFGIPQFMPSSYVVFAVDENNDGIVDLYDYPDAFASVANYLRQAGWRTGNERRMRRAVFRYNNQKAYVKAVFAYAESI